MTELLPIWLQWDKWLFAFMDASFFSLLFGCSLLALVGYVFQIGWMIKLGNGLKSLIGSIRGGSGNGKGGSK